MPEEKSESGHQRPIRGPVVRDVRCEWTRTEPSASVLLLTNSGISRTVECREPQRFLEDHEQPDLLDAWYDCHWRAAAEQFGDASGVGWWVHAVELTGPERGADVPGR